MKPIGFFLQGLFVFLFPHWGWSQESCVDGPQLVAEACSGIDVDNSLDEAEGQFPQKYGLVTDLFPGCASAVGSCFKNCKSSAVTSGSLVAMMKALEATAGSPPIPASVYRCRILLAQFAGEIDSSCKARLLIEKSLLEPETPGLLGLAEICRGVSEIEFLTLEIPVESSAVKGSDGTFVPIGNTKNDETLDPESDGDLEASEIEEQGALNSSEESFQEGSSTGRAQTMDENRRSGLKKGVGGKGRPKERTQKEKSLLTKSKDQDMNFGLARSGTKVQKIPSHGLSPQQRMGRELLRKKEGEESPWGPSVPHKKVHSLPLKMGPKAKNIWEIHSEAFGAP